MKKYLAIVLATAILLCAAPLAGFTAIDWPEFNFGNLFPSANAAEIVKSGTCGAEGDGRNLTWTLDSDGVLTISGSGKMRGRNTGDSIWDNSSKITVAVLKKGITSIGAEALKHCSSLVSVTIPDGVTSIEEGAFLGCSKLTEITIPDSVVSIGKMAFGYCSKLKSVTIPKSVTRIGVQAFYYCSDLADIIIQDSETIIDGSAFSMTAWYRNQPEGLLYAGKVLCEYKGTMQKNTSIIIKKGTKSISDSVFWRCNGLTSVTIPDSVTYIGDSAFFECVNLTGVTIPDSVTHIGNSAFSGCDALTGVTIPDSVTYVGANAFYYCENLTNVTIKSSGATRIGNNAFNYCENLADVTIGNGVNNIGFGAFDNTAWYNNQPDGYVYAGKVLYDYKGYKTNDPSLVIEKGVTGIAAHALASCKWLTSVTLPDTVTCIGEEAFWGCENLKNVTIPESITSLKYEVFYGCRKLTEINIPNSVKSIGNSTFRECSGLKHVKIPDGVTSIGESAFEKCTNLVSVTIPDSVRNIGERAFYCCHKLASVTIPGGVTSIKKSTFRDCSSLSSVTIQKGATIIETDAFYDCKSLASITIPDSITTIKDGVFCACKSLTGVTLPDSVTTIGSGVFEECSSLSSITIPSSATNIGNAIFYNCKGLTSVTLPDSLTTIPYSMFSECSGLTDITIPHSVTEIRDHAFAGCTGLTSVTIPDSVTSIRYSAFFYCENLVSMAIPDSVTSIGFEVFSGCNKLTLIVAEGSTAHKYAVRANIDYTFNGVTIVSYEHDDEEYLARFSPELFSESSAKSNKNLAMLAGMLSWEAEHYDYASMPLSRPLYEKLDISSGNIKNSFVDRDTFLDLADLGVSFCSTIAMKEITIDGKKTNLLILIGRGTQTLREGIMDAVPLAQANFYDYTQFKVYNMIDGYCNDIMSNLDVFCETHPELKEEPLKILITGHSLGGAVANLLGARFTFLADGGEWWSNLVDKDDIFVYTFGAIDSINSDGTVSNGYENIHNITNFYDTFGPNSNSIIKPAGKSRYGKFGHIDLFYSMVIGRGIFGNHEMPTYLDAIKEGKIDYENKKKQKYASWQCPVDVKIYRDGELVGQVTDNKVVDSVTTIPISLVDDEKYALLEGDGEYTFEMTGTDTGMMTYTIADATTGETQQKFENVALEAGKTMTSAVGPETAAEEIRLFVVNDAGDAVMEVAPDGTEHEPQPVFTPGDVDGNGKVESADARLALRASVHLTDDPKDVQEGSEGYKASDYDANGKVESSDARAILRVSVKLDPFG